MPAIGLRGRITLLVVGVVAFCLATVFAAVYRGTASRLKSATDTGLREDLAELRHAIVAPTPALMLDAARSFVERQPSRATTHVLFVSAAGHAPVTNEPELLDTSRGDADDTAAARRAESHEALGVLRAPDGFSDRRLPGVGPVRVFAAHRGSVRFGVAEPLEPVAHAKSTVARALLLAGALGMAGALLGGLLIASSLAAPLRRMARVAARVDAGDLSHRMELGGPHDEVRALAHSFDQMLDRLEDAFARQSAFVADASHELRTPLTIVRGQLEVLAMNPHPGAEAVRHVESVVRPEIDRMNRLVEDLLLLAHAGDPDLLRREPVDLPDFLAGIVTGLQATTDRRLVLGPAPALVIDADPDRLGQALHNVLRNAIVHTEPCGLVRLSAYRHGERVRLIVDDDGPGIPEDQRARIFDRFARLDAARGRDSGGAGLGLSIVSAITVAHGGDVAVESSPEGGARFILELPRNDTEGGPDRSDQSVLIRGR